MSSDSSAMLDLRSLENWNSDILTDVNGRKCLPGKFGSGHVVILENLDLQFGMATHCPFCWGRIYWISNEKDRVQAMMRDHERSYGQPYQEETLEVFMESFDPCETIDIPFEGPCPYSWAHHHAIVRYNPYGRVYDGTMYCSLNIVIPSSMSLMEWIIVERTFLMFQSYRDCPSFYVKYLKMPNEIRPVKLDSVATFFDYAQHIVKAVAHPMARCHNRWFLTALGSLRSATCSEVARKALEFISSWEEESNKSHISSFLTAPPVSH